MADTDGPLSARSGWAIAAVLVGAAATRLALLRTTVVSLDGDEAVTGLMARRILDGHHRAFFAGQDYMGSGEQYLQAAILAVLPDTDLVLRLPQVGLAVVACFLIHRVALRCGLSPRRALLAAALFAAGPYFAVYWGARSRGAYSSALVLGLAGLLIALSVDLDDRRRLAKVALFGVIAGAAFWANQQAAFLLVPAAWWLLAALKRTWASSMTIGALGFVVGAAPSIWHTLAGGPSPFANHESDTSVAERAQHFLVEALPDLLGVRDHQQPLLSWIPPALVVLLAALALGAAASQRRSGLLAVAQLRTEHRKGIDLILLVLLVSPVLYVQSGAAMSASARFVFVLFGVLPIAAAALPLPRAVIHDHRGASAAAVLLVVLVALHTAYGAERLMAQDDGRRPAAAGQVVVNPDLAAVVDALVAAGAETAYADYWLAHPLNWEADGRVLVESLVTRRFPHISAAVDADPSPALIVARSEVDAVRDALTARGSTYELRVVSDWGIVTSIEPGVHLGWTLSIVEGLAAAP